MDKFETWLEENINTTQSLLNMTGDNYFDGLYTAYKLALTQYREFKKENKQWKELESLGI